MSICKDCGDELEACETGRCDVCAAAYRKAVLTAKADARGLVIDRLSQIPPEPITPAMSDAEIEAAMRRVVKQLEQAVQHL